VSAAAVEVVDINQIKAIKAKRRRDIKRLDAAVGAVRQSSNNAAALLLPENEHQYRPFSKAMATKWFKPLDEEEDIPARDEAIRRSWQAALKGNQDDVAAAAKSFPQFAKDDPYEPMARMYADTTRTQAEKDAILAARVARFAKLGRLLLEQGRRGDVERIFEELLG
jgi:hypothetical protein